jgi:hypothetical protein
MRWGLETEPGGSGVPPETVGKWRQLGLLALAETLAMKPDHSRPRAA